MPGTEPLPSDYLLLWSGRYSDLAWNKVETGERMTWEQWWRKYRRAIGSDDYGFEALFARNVLPLVPGLRPEEVTPQLTVGVRGRNRRIDFAIQRGGIKLAAEIDGWDKTGTGQGMSRAQHQDFLSRQNDLTGEGWTFLRFTPVDVRDRPADVVRQVSKALDKPQHHRRTAGPEAEQVRSEPTFHGSREFQPASSMAGTGQRRTNTAQPPPPRTPPAAAAASTRSWQPSTARDDSSRQTVVVLGALITLAALAVVVFAYLSGTSTGSGQSASYANCSEARAAGAAPLSRGEPGYGSHLDRDSDGIACEE